MAELFSDFPVFDLSAFARADADGRVKLGAQVDQICRTTGFLAVSGHGVSDQTIADMWRITRSFFDLTPTEKLNVKAPYPGYPYGYIGPELEALAASRGQDTPPDLKESFNGGPLAVPNDLTDKDALAFCYADTLWPDAPANFKAAWQAYYGAMEGLAARIMEVFAVALGLDARFFDDKIDHPISALRALNYPAQSVEPKEGQLRAGAHSDYGSLTILLPQPGTKGLQILMPDNVWREVPPVEGAFVINIGDLMAQWTNDKWVSTLHRVVNPEAATGQTSRRQSLAFFHQPNWLAEISCLDACLEPGETSKYEPVLSGPYLMNKFKSTVK